MIVESFFSSQAKYLAQIIVTSTQIIGRAFARALKQEIQSSQNAAKARSAGTREGSQSAATSAYSGITLQVGTVYPT